MRKVILMLLAAVLLSSFKQKQISWVAIGDSITYLNDHTDETGNRVKKGYLTRVTELLPNLRYINQGHNGWTAGGIAEKIDGLRIPKADLYSVFLGTNDWWAGRAVGDLIDYKDATGNKTLYGSFRIIINKIHSLNPQAKIILVTPMQRNDFVYINDARNNAYGSYKLKNGHSLEEFAGAVISIGKYEQLPVVDLYHDRALQIEDMIKFKRLKEQKTGRYAEYTYPLSAEIPFNPATDEYPYPPEAANITYDGLHPSDKGNAIIAERLAKILKGLGF